MRLKFEKTINKNSFCKCENVWFYERVLWVYLVCNLFYISFISQIFWYLITEFVNKKKNRHICNGIVNSWKPRKLVMVLKIRYFYNSNGTCFLLEWNILFCTTDKLKLIKLTSNSWTQQSVIIELFQHHQNKIKN